MWSIYRILCQIMIYLERGSDKMFSITDFDEICEYAHIWNWSPDWHMVKQIYSAFPDSYSILTPFAYTYLEELIRSTTSKYGIPLLDREGKKNNIKVGLKLVNFAIKENSENQEYVELLEKAKKYFKYDYYDSHEENGRNKVLNGHLHPRFWSKEDFEKLIHDIAELSPFAGF